MSTKLVAVVTGVNNKYNDNLIGSIVVVDSKLKVSHCNELCYEEVDHGRKLINITSKTDWTPYFQFFNLKHSILNLEIIGEL